MEKRVLQVADDSWRMERIKRREMEKKQRQQTLASLKRSPMPLVGPDLTHVRDLKCDKCNDDTEFVRSEDWFMEPIDAMMLKDKLFEGWFSWMKTFLLSEPLLPVSVTSLAIHPAHIKMIKNLRKNNPETPVVFVVTSRTPEVDILLINYALRVNNVKSAVIDVDNLLPQNLLVELFKEESQIKVRLENDGNVLILLDGDKEENLKRVLRACGFGKSKKVFFLPISINSEKNIQSFSTVEPQIDLGIVKINFHVPYQIDDLLRRQEWNDDAEERVEAISKHLLYDVTMKRPIMSTNVVAFLLLTEFRDGTTVKNLEERLDDFRQSYHSIDFAFQGNAEDVVEHAVEILSERLIKIDGDSITINSSYIVELSSYAEALVPHFALASLLIIAAQTLKRMENFIDFCALVTTATELCELLENQIKFGKPCEDFASQLNRAFDSCSCGEIFLKPVVQALSANEQRALRMARQYELENEDSDDDGDAGYQSRNPNNEVTINEGKSKEIEASRNVTFPILDAYLTAAFGLKKIIGEEAYAVDEFIKCAVKAMREELEDKRCFFWESCSEYWMRSSLKYFESWGIIVIDRTGDNPTMTLHRDHNNNKAVNFLIQRLDRFFEAT